MHTDEKMFTNLNATGYYDDNDYTTPTNDVLNTTTVAHFYEHQTDAMDDFNAESLTTSKCLTLCNPLTCLNRGTCCINEQLSNEPFCNCLPDYRGHRCETRIHHDDYDDIAASLAKLEFIGVSSIVCLVIGMIALCAFIVLIVLILRQKLSLRRMNMGIEENVAEIEKTINQMPTVTKMVQLTRLTKIFEASAQATVEEVMQTALSSADNKAQPSSSSMTSCLPRWSSAPSSLHQQSTPNGTNYFTVDNATADSSQSPRILNNGHSSIPMAVLTGRRKLVQMFSTPVL